MPLISVIVPVYNAGKYLERCLQSLADQTAEELEVLAVNDGSSDNSLAVMQEFEKRYPQRFRIFNQENSGISHTRNVGLQNAKGLYIGFVDSDDWVEPEMFQTLLEAAESHKLDVAVCPYYEDRESAGTSRVFSLQPFEDSSLAEEPRLLFDINMSPWNKLYRRQVLDEAAIRFPEGMKYEDTPFVMKALLKAERIGFVDKPLLHYVVHAGSETTVLDKRVFDIYKVLDLVNGMIGETEQQELFKDYQVFFNIDRITTYNLQQLFQKDKSQILPFISYGFVFLREQFPDWKKNPVFLMREPKWKRLIKGNRFLTVLFVYILRPFRNHIHFG